MPWVDYFAYQFAFYILIFIINLFHKRLYDKQVVIGFWFHVLWGFAYAFPVTICCLIEKNWFALGGILALERFVIYNINLNLLRGEKMFYLGKAKYASWWDDIERWWGDAYPYLWGVAAAFYLYIQTKLW